MILFREIYRWRFAVFGVIGFGVLARLLQFASGRSLWLDEAFLVINILKRSYSGLLEPLAQGQAAPPAFLVTVKFLAGIGNAGESALRLFPLVCGILSIFPFYAVLRRVVSGSAARIAGLFLFAAGEPLIYYSSEVKQYAGDVLFGLLILLGAIRCLETRFRGGAPWGYAIVASVAVWFSHASLFVFLGTWCALAARFLSGTKKPRRGAVLLCGLPWCLSAAACYVTSLREIASHPYLTEFWKTAFVPLPPGLDTLRWFFKTLGDWWRGFLDLRPALLTGLLAVLGAADLWRNRRTVAAMIFLPFLFTFAASAARKYPFHGRLALFLAPFALLCIARGFSRLMEACPRGKRVAALVLAAVVCGHPAARSLHHMVHPRMRHEIKPVLAYVHNRQQAGDVLYLYHRSCWAFEYYSAVPGALGDGAPFKIPIFRGIKSVDRPAAYREDLDRLSGKSRVWVLFSSLYHPDERAFFEKELERMGRRIDAFEAPGAFVWCYDLSESKRERTGDSGPGGRGPHSKDAP
jgi:hypothetical protein